MNRYLLLALVLVALPVAGSAQDGAPRGNAETGKQLYDTKACYSCHGYVGQGSREGPRITPPMPAQRSPPVARVSGCTMSVSREARLP